MYHNSIGGVKLRGLHRLPRFFKLAFAARRAALDAPGCVKVDMFRRGRLFLVLSVWSDAQAMHDYARGPTHGALLREGPRMFHFSRNTVVTDEAVFDRPRAETAWRGVFSED